MQPAPWVIPVAIAVSSLIVVPGVVAIVKMILQHRRDAKAAALHATIAEHVAPIQEQLDDFVTREEHDEHFDRLTTMHERQHKENRDFLDTIRTEAHSREGRLLQSIDGVHKRVDNLFERLGRA